MVPPLLVLALEYHREPLNFPHLTDSQRALPYAFGEWLTKASVALAPSRVDATAESLGTDAGALRHAFLFFLREVLLAPQADHYRVLGLSRECAADAIKGHHGILARLFHPDRQGDAEETRLAPIIRINAAYQTLRDPQKRRRYDATLAPVAACESGEFFRHAGPFVSTALLVRAPAVVPARARRILAWTLGSAAVGALAYLALHEPKVPLLRINSEKAGDVSQGPSYLYGAGREHSSGGIERDGEASTRSAAVAALPVDHPVAASDDGPPDSAETANETSGSASHPTAVATAAKISRTPANSTAVATEVVSNQPEAQRRTLVVEEKRGDAGKPQEMRAASAAAGRTADKAPVGTQKSVKVPTKAESEEPHRAPGVAKLIRQMERCFEGGGVGCFIRLFTANAVVNEGVGALGVGNTYVALAGRTGQGRVEFGELRWHDGPNERLVGKGEMRMSAWRESSQVWTIVSGTVEIEVVPWMGEYRVTKLIHSLPRN